MRYRLCPGKRVKTNIGFWSCNLKSTKFVLWTFLFVTPFFPYTIQPTLHCSSEGKRGDGAGLKSFDQRKTQTRLLGRLQVPRTVPERVFSVFKRSWSVHHNFLFHLVHPWHRLTSRGRNRVPCPRWVGVDWHSTPNLRVLIVYGPRICNHQIKFLTFTTR